MQAESSKRRNREKKTTMRMVSALCDPSRTPRTRQQGVGLGRDKRRAEEAREEERCEEAGALIGRRPVHTLTLPLDVLKQLLQLAGKDALRLVIRRHIIYVMHMIFKIEKEIREISTRAAGDGQRREPRVWRPPKRVCAPTIRGRVRSSAWAMAVAGPYEVSVCVFFLAAGYFHSENSIWKKKKS
jgi:hypothetical protein